MKVTFKLSMDAKDFANLVKVARQNYVEIKVAQGYDNELQAAVQTFWDTFKKAVE